MKKTILCLLGHLLGLSFLIAQDNIQTYKGKTYIFDAYEPVKECSELGAVSANTASTTALKGALFTVERVLANGDLVIKFNEYKIPKSRTAPNYPVASNNRALYNYKLQPDKGRMSLAVPNDNVRFFLLAKAVMTSSCSEYTITSSWDISFGTITTPFKFRSSPFLFTTNLNLGASICFQKKFLKNFSWGIIPGLSLSSISLDSFTTKGVVTASSDRPAITPSIHGMLGYKNINLVVGVGWDFINKTSDIEKSWIYQGKMWLGVGIGVSLFNANTQSTTSTQDQAK